MPRRFLVDQVPNFKINFLIIINQQIKVFKKEKANLGEIKKKIRKYNVSRALLMYSTSGHAKFFGVNNNSSEDFRTQATIFY